MAKSVKVTVKDSTHAPAKAHTPAPMTVKEVEQFIKDNGLKGASHAGHSEDGTRIHVWYKAFRDATAKACVEAEHAETLGLSKSHYTGKLDRVWNTKSGDLIVTMLVELERDRKYRSFNINKGEVFKIAVLGK